MSVSIMLTTITTHPCMIWKLVRITDPTQSSSTAADPTQRRRGGKDQDRTFGLDNRRVAVMRLVTT